MPVSDRRGCGRCARLCAGGLPPISEKLRRLTREAGRDPARMGIEVWVSPGAGTPDDWRRDMRFFKQAGVTHVTAHTTFANAHHRRIAGTNFKAHLSAIPHYREAVADLL